MILPSILTVLAPACIPDGIDKEQPESTACEAGFLLDGSSCVPESCGIGAWGGLPVDEDTTYVDGMAEEGGDGSEAAPYETIQRGLNRAGALGGGLVAVAAGTYPETLEFTTDHADVLLAGRCREMVILDASVGDGETPGIGIDVGFNAVEAAGLTVLDSSFVGILAESGSVGMRDVEIQRSTYIGMVAYTTTFSDVTEVAMESCLIEGSTEHGLFADYANTQVTLVDTTIRNTMPDTNGSFGRGIGLQDGAVLSADGCLIEGNTEIGLFGAGSGTEITLRDTTIRNTLSDANGNDGRGIEVYGGAALSTDRCLIDGNTESGVLISGTGTAVVLRDTIVRDTHPRADGSGGRGIDIYDGATLSAEGCLIGGNTDIGLFAGDSGTRVALDDTTVSDTHPDAEGVYGVGIQVANGATLSADDCIVAGNTTVGIAAFHPGTQVVLLDTTVRDTHPDIFERYGGGIGVQEGAALSAEGCLVEGNVEQGMYASGPDTRVTLRDTRVRGTRPNTVGEFGRGVGVEDGATLSAEGCLIVENTEIGLFASADTRVTLRDSTVSGTRPCAAFTCSVASGVTVQAGARLRAFHLVARSNEGPGLIVSGEESNLECLECTVEDNQFAGAAVLRGGSLSISDSTIEGTMPSVNLLGGAGVYAWPWYGSPPSLSLRDTLIRDNPVAGVWLIGNGSYVITSNSISGGDGEPFSSGIRCGDAILARDGVQAWDDTTGLLLQDNEFLDASGAGVFLDGSSALLSGDIYDGNAVDLVVQDQACDVIPNGYAEAPLRVLCPIWEYPTCYAEFFFVAMPADPVDWEEDKALLPRLSSLPPWPPE